MGSGGWGRDCQIIEKPGKDRPLFWYGFDGNYRFIMEEFEIKIGCFLYM